MNSETYIDFCFVRHATGNFALEIHELLQDVFSGVNLNWYMEEKIQDGIEIVMAEVKGMSRWHSEDEALRYLEEQAGDTFWEYLQGYQMYIYPVSGGCRGCGTH